MTGWEVKRGRRQDAWTCAVCVGARQRLGCGAGTEEVRERLSVCPSIRVATRLSTRLTPATCWGSTLDTKYPLALRSTLALCLIHSILGLWKYPSPLSFFFRDKRIPSSSLPSSSTRSYYTLQRVLSTSSSNTRLSYALHGFSLLLLLLLAIDHRMLLTGLLCFFIGDMFGTPQ